MADRFEFVNATTGTVTEYELESIEDHVQVGRLAYLRNVQNGKLAQVYARSLIAGPTGKGSHWRPA